MEDWKITLGKHILKSVTIRIQSESGYWCTKCQRNRHSSKPPNETKCNYKTKVINEDLVKAAYFDHYKKNLDNLAIKSEYSSYYSEYQDSSLSIQDLPISFFEK